MTKHARVSNKGKLERLKVVLVDPGCFFRIKPMCYN